MVMLTPDEALRLTLLGVEVKSSVPCSTVNVMVDRFVSTSPTESSLVPVKLIAVLAAVVTEVDADELMAVPLNWLTGGSFSPVTSTVRVVVEVAPFASVTS